MEYISKSLLRKTILQYRRLLEQSEYEIRNKKLVERLKEYVEKNDFQMIHTFLPMIRNKEVNVQPLFTGWRKKGRKIIVSKTDFRTREMNHFILEKKTKLIENSMGIPEPIDGDLVDFIKADLILIPLLVCDEDKNRIGYGGGFYDQLLLETNATKVGLSLSPPLDSILQKEEWDVPLDYIISYK
jgi:5-formyltetrahydrofolate cyclo-ligase